MKYHPYGAARSTTGSMVTDKLFTGQQKESPVPDTLGLYDYGARFYSTLTGRFLSPDPVVPKPGDPQTLNRYAYVRNNPLRYTDPSGYDACPGILDRACDLGDAIRDAAQEAGGKIKACAGDIFVGGVLVYAGATFVVLGGVTVALGAAEATVGAPTILGVVVGLHGIFFGGAVASGGVIAVYGGVSIAGSCLF